MNRRRLLVISGLFLISIAIGGCFLFPNHSPEAFFTATRGEDPDNPDDQLVVRLDASASTDPDGDEIVSYMWTLGDDGVVRIDPLETTMTVHEEIILVKYPFEVSNIEVMLVVVDSRNGMSDPVTQTISVPIPE
jgi:hypothetical protein